MSDRPGSIPLGIQVTPEVSNGERIMTIVGRVEPFSASFSRGKETWQACQTIDLSSSLSTSSFSLVNERFSVVSHLF